MEGGVGLPGGLIGRENRLDYAEKLFLEPRNSWAELGCEKNPVEAIENNPQAPHLTEEGESMI